ncbi:MAG: disulfide bond formation protein B [Methylocystis sp.]
MRLAALARENISRAIALAVLFVASGTIAGAWTFQSMGYIPCELCLLGRVPFYTGIPLAALTALAAHKGAAGLARGGLALLALVFLVGAGIAVYHSGVEFHLWPGPTECSGELTGALSPDDFLAQLKRVKPVRCDEPALLVFGLSLAAWEAVVSMGLAALAAWGWRRAEARS